MRRVKNGGRWIKSDLPNNCDFLHRIWGRQIFKKGTKRKLLKCSSSHFFLTIWVLIQAVVPRARKWQPIPRWKSNGGLSLCLSLSRFKLWYHVWPWLVGFLPSPSISFSLSLSLNCDEGFVLFLSQKSDVGFGEKLFEKLLQCSG